jgi:hypothetical protein
MSRDRHARIDIGWREHVVKTYGLACIVDRSSLCKNRDDRPAIA